MKRKIMIVIILAIFLISFSVNVYAGMLDKIIEQGSGFNGSTSGIGNEVKSFIEDDILTAVTSIGNLVFAAVTVILGMKYIWESAEGKAQILESLPGFILAVVFFYLGKDLVLWLNDSTNGIGSITTATTWTSVAGKVIWVINTIVRYGSFAGIIFMGLRYMFAAADTRANLKSSFGGMVIGILFVFAASQVVDYIIDAADIVI